MSLLRFVLVLVVLIDVMGFGLVLPVFDTVFSEP